MKPLIVIDSNCIGHIAKHSMKGLSYGDYETGVIFGFMQITKRIATKFQSNRFVFAWDSRRSIRRDMYPAYKRQRIVRQKTEVEIRLDDAAYRQFAYLRKSILPKIGFKNNFINVGYEADDIIAHIVHNSKNDKKIVVSRDDDLLQLLDDCDIYDPISKELITRKDFIRSYNIEPQRWVDVKCLAGCPSDGVSGLSGIGINRAISFIRGVLKKDSSYFEKIKNSYDEIIHRNHPLICLPLSGLEIPVIAKDIFNIDDFMDVCDQYDFRSFLKKDELENWREIFNMGE